MSSRLDAFAPFSARIRSLVHVVTNSYNRSLFFAPKLREPLVGARRRYAGRVCLTLRSMPGSGTESYSPSLFPSLFIRARGERTVGL